MGVCEALAQELGWLEHHLSVPRLWVRSPVRAHAGRNRWNNKSLSVRLSLPPSLKSTLKTACEGHFSPCLIVIVSLLGMMWDDVTPV